MPTASAHRQKSPDETPELLGPSLTIERDDSAAAPPLESPAPAPAFESPEGRPGEALAGRPSPASRVGGWIVPKTVLWPLALLVAIVLVWTGLSSLEPSSILPGPSTVWLRFVDAWRSGTYLPAFGTTFEEACLGWLIGAACGLPLGYAVGRWRGLEQSLAPYLAASQAMPLVAIAPLLLIWVGVGMSPKVVVAALIAFFPIMTTTASGMRGIDRDLRDVARAFGAGWRQTLLYLELPRSARSIFAGFKIAAALSVTGAVVGEFVASDQGLGALMLLGQQRFDTPLMFVALVSLMLLGAAGYALMSLAERMVLRWTE